MLPNNIPLLPRAPFGPQGLLIAIAIMKEARYLLQKHWLTYLTSVISFPDSAFLVLKQRLNPQS
jgi:hypothetical protein